MKAAKKRKTVQHTTDRMYRLLVYPILIYAVLLCIVPLFYSLGISFTSYSLTSTQKTRFVAFSNYIEQLIGENSFFWQSLKLTLIFTVISVTVGFTLGFILAYILSRNVRGQSIFRSILILPLAIAPAIVALIFRYMMNDDYGVINYLTKVIANFKIEWLIDPKGAMLAICFADIWQYTSFFFLILLAGILSLPKEPYEAAMLDGANSFAVFCRVTLPLLKPVISIVLLFRIIDSFNSFDKAYVLTRGGPSQATETLGMHIYKVGLATFNIGQAAAISWLVLIILYFISRKFVKLCISNSSK